MITEKNESEMLCKCKFHGRKHHVCEKDYIWNPAACDEIIDAEETKIIPKNIICETKIFYVLLTLLLITIALLIAFSIYFCLIKYKAKQKHLLLYYVKDDKLIYVW